MILRTRLGRLKRSILVKRSNYYQLQKIGRVSVGKSTYGEPTVLHYAHDNTRLTIGSYSSIAKGVTIVLGGNHPTDRITTFPFRIQYDLPDAGTDGYPSSKGDIFIGSDVWIGYGATILSGSYIGHGAVIAAGALVTGVIPAFSIASGVPAQVKRYRFDEKTRAALLDVAWWDWPESRVLSHIDALTVAPTEQSLQELVKARPAT